MMQGDSPAGTPSRPPQGHGEFVDTRAPAEPAFDLGRAPPHVERLAARERRRPALWGAVLLALAVVAALAYWFQQRASSPPPVAPPVAGTPSAPPAEPPVRHPIEDARPEAAAPVAAAPPSLDESDPAVADALAALVGRGPLEQFATLSGFVRNVVATIDNLPRNKAPRRVWPLVPTPGPLVTTGGKDATYLGAENYRRYEPALRLMESVDTGQLVALYVRLYPLFQQAYRDLGYPDRYFNDRLIEVIDHLLATPDVPGPIALAQPHVLYVFADPALEARSAGQKILLRIGPANAARVKAKLRDIRRQVTGRALPR